MRRWAGAHFKKNRFFFFNLLFFLKLFFPIFNLLVNFITQTQWQHHIQSICMNGKKITVITPTRQSTWTPSCSWDPHEWDRWQEGQLITATFFYTFFRRISLWSRNVPHTVQYFRQSSGRRWERQRVTDSGRQRRRRWKWREREIKFRNRVKVGGL